MKQLNRRVYAIVGVIVLLFAGLVYAWSVLSTPIAAEFTGWTKAQLSLTFTLVMILFCIGSLLCGLLAGKLSAKNAVRLGAVLFLAGFYIASRCQTPLTLYLGFGVLCGLGSGLSYNAVMSTMVKWFPDKPGLISGVLLMGFGGGSFLIGKLYQAWTPVGIGGWRTSFVVLGIVCFAVLAVCSFFFVAPRRGLCGSGGQGRQGRRPTRCGRHQAGGDAEKAHLLALLRLGYRRQRRRSCPDLSGQRRGVGGQRRPDRRVRGHHRGADLHLQRPGSGAVRRHV